MPRPFGLLLSLLLFAFLIAAAQSSTITVSINADSGPGTLRQAILDAAPGDTINFAITGRINLTSGELLLDKDLIVTGPGMYSLGIQGNVGTNFRVLHVAPASVTVRIAGLAIRNGHDSVDAGGILNTGTLILSDSLVSGNTGRGILNSGTLTVINSTVVGNRLLAIGTHVSHGAGILNTGILSVANSEVSGNNNEGHESWGAGIANTGTATITTSKIILNMSETSYQGGPSNNRGGGVANFDNGVMTISDSLISENECEDIDPGESTGAGIANFGNAAMTITNSTISGNRCQLGVLQDRLRRGGGLANLDNATLIIRSSTIVDNRADRLEVSQGCGGGVYLEGGQTRIQSTIIGGNFAHASPDVCGPLVSDGFNLIGNSAGGTITPSQPSDLIGTSTTPIDPRVGLLQDNGGPTQTRAIQSDSPAIDLGSPDAPESDQRGYFRLGPRDMGAFEFAGLALPGSLGNISTRLRVETGDLVLIAGFIITGTQPKKIVIRAIGPSLPMNGALEDPILELHDNKSDLIATNDNWRSDQESLIISTGIPPTNDLESAIVATLPANDSAYTAIVRGLNGTGVGLVEVYDLDRTADSQLGNISTRGLVQVDNDVLIAGTIVIGSTSQRTIIRAIGPSLPLAGTLANPTLEIHDTSGALIAFNDNWRSDQEEEILATGLPPSDNRESAIVQVLNPSNYTAIVRGVGDTTGIALVEVYAIP